MKYLEQVAAVKLTGAKLIKAHELVMERKQEDVEAGETPDFTTTMIALVQAVPEHFARDEVPAIIFRMQALNELLKAGVCKGWAEQDRVDTGRWFANEVLFDAAAVATLDLNGDEPAFDPDEFKSLALKAADPEGKA